ncbi:MAG: cation transporter [Flavobacteriales bacterium]|nr:cation transporter [Flavobacteriales bacterium]
MPADHAHHHHAGHPHDHAHGHVSAASAHALRLAFFVNFAFTIVEVIGGWWTGSIAVLTDAMHDAGDCLVLGTAWYLQRIAMKDRDTQYSYGYGRYSMLGGWLTSVVLIVGAIGMLVVSIPKLWEHSTPNSLGMIGMAIFGLAMNGFAAWKLHGGATLNERGAYLHLMEDVLGWAAVLIGGIVIYFFGWVIVDPILSIAISVYILFNAVGTLRKGTGILMQEIPPGIDQEAVHAKLMAIPHVTDLHDQHTWTLDGRFIVHTVHIVVADVDHKEALVIKSRAREELQALGIHHATIELEWADEHCGLQHH